MPVLGNHQFFISMDLLVIIINSNKNNSCLFPLLFKWSVFVGLGLTAIEVDALESYGIILSRKTCWRQDLDWCSAIKGLAGKQNELCSLAWQNWECPWSGVPASPRDIPPVLSSELEWQERLPVFSESGCQQFQWQKSALCLNHTEYLKLEVTLDSKLF